MPGAIFLDAFVSNADCLSETADVAHRHNVWLQIDASKVAMDCFTNTLDERTKSGIVYPMFR